MSINHNHHISPLANMHRYFAEKSYRTYYALIRKAYKVGYLNSAIAVNNELYKRYPRHAKLISNAWVTFCSVVKNQGDRLV